jgi:hypothetical protein
MTREQKLQEIENAPSLIASVNAEFNAEEQKARDQAAYEIEAARTEFDIRKKVIYEQLATTLKGIAERRTFRLTGIEARTKQLVALTPPIETELSSSSVDSQPISTSDNENKSKSTKNKKLTSRHL